MSRLICVFCLGLQLFFTYSTLCAASAEEVPEFLGDYSDKVIVRHVVLSESGDDEEGDTVSTFSVSENLKKRLEETVADEASSKIYVLQYRTSGLNDMTFQELTEHVLPLLPEGGPMRFILDISGNGVTAESIVSLQQWLEKTSVFWVNIDNNSGISKRHVKSLCSAFLDILGGELDGKKGAIRTYMAKLVFLPRYYISKAKRLVKVYRDLEDKGYLPADWDVRQKRFYKIMEGDAVEDLSLEGYSPSDEEADASDLA